MHQLFNKYPDSFDEKVVVKALIKKMECAKKALEESDKNSKEYLHHLAVAMDMLSIYFVERGINPAMLLQQ